MSSDCAAGIRTSITYIGNHDTHECEIELNHVSLENNGTWFCDMRTYYSGKNETDTDSLELRVLHFDKANDTINTER